MILKNQGMNNKVFAGNVDDQGYEGDGADRGKMVTCITLI